MTVRLFSLKLKALATYFINWLDINHWLTPLVFLELLWTAPEILRNEKVIDRQKADIYSLGIILKEVFTRSGPYTEFSFLSPSGILQ